MLKTLEQYPKLTASRLYVMVRERGYSGGEDHFRHLVAHYRPRPQPEAYLRLKTLPGEQAQVDWGHFRKLAIGKAEHTLMAFVMVLSFSRAIFLRFFLDARMILLLAIHQRMSPAEINQLNLTQVTRKFGRDNRPRVYLKKRLVKKKAVGDAFWQFRQRNREASLWPKDPMFRTKETGSFGVPKRMGAKAIEAVILRYLKRALKVLPDVLEEPEPKPVVPNERPPVFWVRDVAYQRIGDGNGDDAPPSD